MNRGCICQVQHVKLVWSVLHRSPFPKVHIQSAFFLCVEYAGHDPYIAVAYVGDVLRLHNLVTLTEYAFSIGEFGF